MSVKEEEEQEVLVVLHNNYYLERTGHNRISHFQEKQESLLMTS